MNSKLRLSGTESILIILMGSLGDVVRGLAVAWQLKQHSNEFKLSWLVDSHWVEIVKLCSAVDTIYIFDRKNPLQAAFGITKQLRTEHFDICLDLQRIFKSGIFSWLSGARRRIAFHRKNSKELNYLFASESIDPQPANFPKLKHYLEFVKRLDLEIIEPVGFGLEALEMTPEVKGLLEEIGGPAFIGLVLSSSRKNKDWPLFRYQELLQLLLSQTEERVVLFGTGQDEQKSVYLIENTDTCFKGRLYSLVGRSTLKSLPMLLKLARVTVGPDSGPGHLAAACASPYIALFGPTEAERVAPFACEDLVLTADCSCRPCLRRHCTEKRLFCMEDISAKRVFDTISRFL